MHVCLMLGHWVDVFFISLQDPKGFSYQQEQNSIETSLQASRTINWENP